MLFTPSLMTHQSIFVHVEVAAPHPPHVRTLNAIFYICTVPAMKNQHELEEPILGQLQGLEKKQAYHVYANQWGYAP